MPKRLPRVIARSDLRRLLLHEQPQKHPRRGIVRG
jgi:hypothetical protein